MIWLSGRRYVGDREVNLAEPEFLPLSEYSKQAWSKTGIFVCFFSVFARLRLRMGILGMIVCILSFCGNGEPELVRNAGNLGGTSL